MVHWGTVTRAVSCLGLGILLVPFFQGPDEQVHYATVQHWAEPDEKTLANHRKP